MNSNGKGIIHGKTIRLDEDPGLPDGQRVNASLEPIAPSDARTSDAKREALRRAAGSWSDDVEGLDRYLKWNRRQRNAGRNEPVQ